MSKRSFILVLNVGLIQFSCSILVELVSDPVARLTPDQKVACSNHVGVNAVDDGIKF